MSTQNSNSRTVLGCLCSIVLAVTCNISIAGKSYSAENATSFYLPGTAGDALLATAPPVGWTVADTIIYQSGKADAAVLQGAINTSIELDFLVNIVSASYTLERKFLDANLTFGVALPIARATIGTTVTGPKGKSVMLNDSAQSIGDLIITPVQLNWTKGDYSFEFKEVIFAPTGRYDVNESVNVGLNHWGFDTAFAATYFNANSGTEFSIASGILFNTKNKKTDYRTGSEFHLDMTINQFLSKEFMIGLRGYYYQQISGDSGSGAVLGDFKGKSFGIGPGFVWIPKSASGNFALQAKWIHDFEATNRFDSDYVSLTAAWTF